MYSVNAPGPPPEGGPDVLIGMTPHVQPDGTREHQVQVLREVGDDERKEVLASLTTLSRIGPHSELHNLDGYLDDFREAVVDQMAHLYTDPNEVRRLFSKTARRFADYLHAFASFDDRTTAFMSKTYGSDSETYEAFKAAMSREYDSNAAYRLFRSLRNVSAHGSQVINNSRINVQAHDDGVVDRELELSITASALVDSFGSRMNAKVRDECAALTEPIHVLTSMNVAHRSCVRLHSDFVREIEDDALASVELLETLTEEGSTHAGLSQVFVGRKPSPDEFGLAGMVRVTEFDWAHVREVIERTATSNNEAPEVVAFADLCVAPNLTISKRADGSIVDDEV